MRFMNMVRCFVFRNIVDIYIMIWILFFQPLLDWTDSRSWVSGYIMILFIGIMVLSFFEKRLALRYGVKCNAVTRARESKCSRE